MVFLEVEGVPMNKGSGSPERGSDVEVTLSPV